MAEFKILESSPKGIYIEIKVIGSLGIEKKKTLTYPNEFPENQIIRSVYSEIEKFEQESSGPMFSSANKGKSFEVTKTEAPRSVDPDSGEPVGPLNYIYDAKEKKAI